MTEPASVSVVLVLVDAGRSWMPQVVESLASQRGVRVELVLIDNTSAQDLEVVAAGAVTRVIMVRNPNRPTYFVDNNNLGIPFATAAAILLLNADAFLEPEYCAQVLRVLRERPDVGIVSGKLLRLDEPGPPSHTPRVDSTGMLLTLGQRHLDRGADQPDCGQYDRGEYVYGATGAALTLRRETLEHVAIDGQCFDPDFVHGREDGELCLRAQLLGWRCWYEPSAVGHHHRTSRHNERDRTPLWLRREHVKARFVMRSNTLPTGTILLLAPFFLVRDLQVLAFTMLRERTSLPAFVWLWRHRRRLLAKRRALMARRRSSSLYMAGLFLGGVRDVVRRRLGRALWRRG